MSFSTPFHLPIIRDLKKTAGEDSKIKIKKTAGLWPLKNPTLT